MNPFHFIAVLALFLVGCRAVPPRFSEVPTSATGTETHEHRGPYADITGAKPDSQEQEIAAALISAMHRSHILKAGSWESDVKRCGKEGATWILHGDKVSISLADMSPGEIELALQDLRAAGLTVKLSP